MIIKKYLEYITELRKIKSSSSNSGSTKYFDLIWDEPLDSKSPSAGVILRQKLSDIEFAEDVFRVTGKAPNKLLRKAKGEKHRERLLITMNNLAFLKDVKKEKELKCEYCGKSPLRIYDMDRNKKSEDFLNGRINNKFSRRDGATVDHKNPISKGGDKFNYDNLAVCCYNCNSKKGNISYEDWMNIISKEE